MEKNLNKKEKQMKDILVLMFRKIFISHVVRRFYCKRHARAHVFVEQRRVVYYVYVGYTE